VPSKLKILALLLLLLAALPIDAAAPSRTEVVEAIAKVKADPNLAPEKTIRTLKWAQQSDDTQPREPPSGALQWLGELIGWFAQSARVVVWVALALLVGMLVIFLLRLLKERSPSMGPRRKAIPTHVQDLDIRPESLPDNIGVAARTLWDNGEHRAALSLLYRGLLSRLVHVHNVPIRDSSTEGDTLQLTDGRLRDDKRDYVSRLIRTWQHAVYGGQQPDVGALYVLCDEFSPALDTA